MPNWCESDLKVSSKNVEQLRQFVQHIGDTERGSVMCLEKLLPIPEELYDSPPNENGLPATVDWKINNCGALCQFAAEASWISDNCIKYVYSTKWWPAVEWIKYAAHLYPDLEFALNYGCWEYEYEGTFKAHGEIYSNEMHKTEIEELMFLSVNDENVGQEGSLIMAFGPEKATFQKH
jgi:hypothetical protein